MKYDFFLSGLEEPFKQKTIDAIKVIEEANATGSIRNVVYNDIKDTLNRACYRADKKLNPDYNYEECSYDLRAFIDNVGYIDSLHSIIALRKKVEKMKERAPLVVYYDRFSSDLLDLALMMKDLKSKVVKGRDPDKKPAPPANPNKIVKTCGCCLRHIAIGKDKTMVHHGFERPGDGYQTDSCAGISFKYLEISDDGPRHMVKTISEMIEKENQNLENFKAAKTFSFLNYNKKWTTINEGDHGFDSYKENMISRQTYHIKALERDLETFKKIVKEWKPTETE